MTEPVAPTREEQLEKLCKATAERIYISRSVRRITGLYNVDSSDILTRIQAQTETFLAAICIHQGWDLNDDQNHAAAAKLVDAWKAEHYPEERPGTTE